MLSKALYYQLHNGKLQCSLCPHNCLIDEDKFGICAVRKHVNRELMTINYAEVTAMASDPIEKKPLYHFKPGSSILSVGSYGCNLSCRYCQNFRIARGQPSSKRISPVELVQLSRSVENNIGLAFTYNEPIIWYEYVRDTARYLKEQYPDQSIVLVTNGFIQATPWRQLLPYVDALNIDLKAFNTSFYQKICGGRLEPVLTAIELASQFCHLEVTTLLVNGLNDSESEIARLAAFLAEIDADIPLHLSRYFPAYQLKKPATKLAKMYQAREIASEYLNYVYLGNVANVDNSTYCPQCDNLLVSRVNYRVESNLTVPVCDQCGCRINLVL